MTHSTQAFRVAIAHPIRTPTGAENLVDHDVPGRLLASIAATGLDGVRVLAVSGAGAA
ncbi:hypothetical protein [Cryobacterium psychrophilum]|uniref:hypothetical protein n=1 Tax=Cryobacterium psychrophilum TaxID=41988 RepID=UPI0010D9B929|nr:hypothetical protein [Cryobacterium psychrophilum]TDW30314.1 hypothetical protein EDD25_2063 [Cryobacterium psychrophilum]